MPRFDDFTEISRKELYIFYVLSLSECPSIVTVEQMNNFITDSINGLKKSASRNADILVKVALL